MITIQNLEIRFDVEGSDEERFAKLFQKFIGQWSRMAEARHALDQLAAGDRALGDQPSEDAGAWR